MDFTVFPIYSIQIQLNGLTVADLHPDQYGYYQIRFRFKRSENIILDYQLTVVPKLENNTDMKPSEVAKAALVENSQSGYSSGMLNQCSQMCPLDDTFHCRLRLAKRLDKMDGPVQIPIQLELWHFGATLPHGKSPISASPPHLNRYQLLARRCAHIQLWPNQGTHCCRPVHFDCSDGADIPPLTSNSLSNCSPNLEGFFTLTMTLHAAICSFRIARQRAQPIEANGDGGVAGPASAGGTKQQPQALTPRFIELHGNILKKLLSSVYSLQQFIQRHQQLLHSPLKLDLVCVPSEMSRLQRDLRQTQFPVDKFEDHLRNVGTRLSRVFTQLIQLFSNTKALNERLQLEHSQQRHRLMAEAFLSIEESAQCLLQAETHFYRTPSPQTLLQLFKHKSYLKHCPKMAIFVDGNDAKCEEMAIILERKYLPPGTTSNYTNDDANAATTNPFLSNFNDEHKKQQQTQAEGLPKLKISEWVVEEDDLSSSVKTANSSAQRTANNAKSIDSENDGNQQCHNGLDEENEPEVKTRKSSWARQCLSLAISSANLERRRTNPELLDVDGRNYGHPLSARERQRSTTLSMFEGADGHNKYILLNGLRTRIARSMGELHRKKSANECAATSSLFTSSRSSSPEALASYSSTFVSNQTTCSTSRSECSGQQIPLLMSGSQRSSSDATLTGTTAGSTNSKMSKDAADPESLIYQECKQVLEFVHRKESFRRQLRQRCPQHDFCLYSDSILMQKHQQFGGGSLVDAENIRQRRAIYEQTHLIVLVHGLEGTSDDLTPYRNYLRLALPDRNLVFLQSNVNQLATWTSLERMAENLLEEIQDFIDGMPISERPTRISFVAHSLGGLIVRALCSLHDSNPLLPKFHTLMTLNSPHLGLLYNQKAANWGLNLFQWWKQSACLEQLMLQDALDLRKTCIYRLSTNGAFARFANVLLVGSNLDHYVPCHSALVEQCKQAMHEPQTQQSRVYAEMLANINESILASSRHTQLVKYTLMHHTLPRNIPKLQQVIGRAVHVATIDNENLVERLVSISAAVYFK